MIDHELVTRKLTLIAADAKALVPFAAKPLDDFLASAVDEVIVERYLERIIGRMIDVNYHLITAAGLPPPPDYHQSFTQLARLGVAPAEFTARIAACAGLRNRLVHDYDEIDVARVHEAASTAVRDVPEYLRHVRDYVARAGA
jgi:uncharacterized protein YutE (UPF0331/DUF86 family)